MKHFVWNLRHSLAQFGMPGTVGLGLLAFCGMFYFSTLLPEQEEAALLQRQLDAIAAAFAPQKVLLPADQLKTFYEFFPGAETAPDTLLAKLHEEAASAGVMLDQGEYRVEHEEGERLVRYSVVLPIRGEYLSIRRFLSRSLLEVPYVSLDKVEFQRDKITDAMLDAQVRMTFFLVQN